MATHHTDRPDVTREVLDEPFLLGESLPEAVALNIVEDGLPAKLRAKPTAIYDSPEVPLEIPEDERQDLLARLNAVDSEALQSSVKPLLAERKRP